jgi:hypothetical protein
MFWAHFGIFREHIPHRLDGVRTQKRTTVLCFGGAGFAASSFAGSAKGRGGGREGSMRKPPPDRSSASLAI